MSQANLDAVIDAIVTTVTGLGITFNSTVVPVVKRKLPKKDERLDPPTQITICAAEYPEKVKWISFSNYVQTIYSVDVTVVSPNDGDEQSNIGAYATWRQQVRQKFQGWPFPMPVVPPFLHVIDVNSRRNVFLDRRALSDMYDYQAVGVDATAIEPSAS